MNKMKILQVCIVSMIFGFSSHTLLWADSGSPMGLDRAVHHCNYIQFERARGWATDDELDNAIETVRQLLEAGADPNIRIPYAEIRGYGADVWLMRGEITPLMLSRVGRVSELLIEYGASVNDCDNYGRTALMLAAFIGDNIILKILLRNGANVNIQNNTGQTALHFAINGGNIEAIELLVNNGTNINIRDNKGWSPLVLANILYKYQPTIEMMIQILTNTGAVLVDNDLHTIEIFKDERMWWDDELNMSYGDR
jgi:hypothetical protein